MAADVTTGPQIVGTAIGALVFAALGALCSRYWFLPRMRRWGITGKAARRQTIFSYAVWGLMATIALVAIIVGIVAWATGTTFRTTS
ncbi:MAG: hypothetical protein QOI86_4663 [Actinomycetota bacterium]|nr:hypothetical protein [Actinomycetota bacterium]